MECYDNKFYVKQNELIALIRQSETERVNLELQLCELDTTDLKQAKNKAKLIRSKLKNLNEEERSSKKRNIKIMRRLNNMELTLEDLLSCSAKLKRLKVECRKTIAKDYPNWRKYADELEKQVTLFRHGRNPEFNQIQPNVAAAEGFPRQMDNKLESNSHFVQNQQNVMVSSEGFPGQANNKYDPEVVPIKYNYDRDRLLIEYSEYHPKKVDGIARSSNSPVFLSEVNVPTYREKQPRYAQSSIEIPSRYPNVTKHPDGTMSFLDEAKEEIIKADNVDMIDHRIKDQNAGHTDRPPIISKMKDLHKPPELPKSVSFKMMPEIKATTALEKKDFASLQIADKDEETSSEGHSSERRILKPDLSKFELTGEFDSRNIYGTDTKTFTKSHPESISGNVGPASENKQITDAAAAEDTEFGINSLPEQLVRCTTATYKSVESISESFGTGNNVENSDDPSDISDFGSEEGLLSDMNGAELNIKSVEAVVSDNSLFGNEWNSQPLTQTLSLNGMTMLINTIEESFHSVKWNKDKFYRTVQALNGGVQDIIKAANTGNKAEINFDPVTISMVIFQQLPLIIQNIPTRCLLPDSLFHAVDWLSLTEKDVISSLGNCPPAISLWKRLFLHFQFIVNNNIMTVPELAAVFIPSLLHKDSNSQTQAFNIIVSLLGNATESNPHQLQGEAKPKPHLQKHIIEAGEQQLSSTESKPRLQQISTESKPQQIEIETDALQQDADTMYPHDFLSDSSSNSLPSLAEPAETNTNIWHKREQENFAMKPTYSNSSPYTHQNKNVSDDNDEGDDKDGEDNMHQPKSLKMASDINISETPAYKTLLTGLMSSISLEEELADSDGDSDDLEKEFGSGLTKPHLSELLAEAGETHSSAVEASPTNKSAKDDSIDFDFYD